MSTNSVFNQLRGLIADFSGYDTQKINLNTSINFDAKIEGDDAIEFLTLFGNTFNVDVSKFKYDNYFSPEGLDLIGGAYKLIIGKRKHYKSLIVLDLLNAIHSKVLDEDPAVEKGNTQIESK
jgi:hypothetical protein